MKFILLLFNILSISLISQNKVNCDSLMLFFHGEETCFAKDNEIYKCGIIVTQRIIPPSIYYYHYKKTDSKWLQIENSVYYPKNINFINNLKFTLSKGFLKLLFTTKNKKQKKWKFRLTKNFDFEKKLAEVEGSLKDEILQYGD